MIQRQGEAMSFEKDEMHNLLWADAEKESKTPLGLSRTWLQVACHWTMPIGSMNETSKNE